MKFIQLVNGIPKQIDSPTATPATTSSDGLMSSTDKAKLDGVATGATANDTNANLRARANHTGTQTASTISDFQSQVTSNSTVQANTTKLAGIASGATANDTDANLKARANHTGTQTASTISDFQSTVTSNTTVQANTTKLAGIATGATANATDAQLRDRSTHTGTQTASTISDFSTAADARITAQKAAASGLASLDTGSKLPTTQHGTYTDATHHAAASQSSNGFMSATDKTKLDNAVARVRVRVVGSAAATSSTTFTAVGDKMLWINSRNTQLKNGIIMTQVTIANRSLEFRVYDVTNAVELGASGTLTTSGFVSVAITKPSADAVIELQIRQTTNGGTAPSVNLAVIEYDTI